MEPLRLNTIDEAIEDFREGKFVIVVDDEDRENEGDLICAAEKITPEMVNFMLKYAAARSSTCRDRSRRTPRYWAHLSPSPSISWKAAPQGSLPTTALPPFRHWPTQHLRRRPLAALDTSTRSMRRTTVYCAVQDTPRPPSTSANWQVSTLLVR